MGAPSIGGWDPCPEGELRRLGQRLALRRRRRLALGAALGAGLAVATVLGAAEVVVRLIEVPGVGAPANCCPPAAGP
jgi:hypothetical protein